MSNKPPVQDDSDADMKVSRPARAAAGLHGLTESLPQALSAMGPVRSMKTLLAMNQKDGFDCMSCAWPDPPDRKTAEFCENGAKAVTWEAGTLTVPREFWADQFGFLDCGSAASTGWASRAGWSIRSTSRPGSEHYQPDQLGQRFPAHSR